MINGLQLLDALDGLGIYDFLLVLAEWDQSINDERKRAASFLYHM